MDSNTQRRRRIRTKVKGTPQRPRVSVYRSNRGLYVQIIDDTTGKTLIASRSKASGSKMDQAQKLGEALSKQAKKEGITAVVFDRGGHKYHGRVRALAEALRKGGLAV